MKTDWKDDIFTRRKLRLEPNDDGTVTPVDETEYTQQGDAFGAKELNAIGEEINEVKKSVSDGKAEIAAAITLKRVVTAATAPFHTMAENIKQIRLGSGNAQPADVLAGKTATNDSGVEFTGTMPERGSKSITLPINGSQDLPAGHYSGVQIRQSIPTLGGQTITPQTYAQTIAAAGKYGTGNHVVAAVPLPPASVIKKGYRYWIGGSYVDGTYVYADITGYYYQAPNEMLGVTGGWNWIAPTDQKPNPGTLSRQQGYMEIKMSPGPWSGGTSSGSNDVACFLVTAKKIDLTKVRTIYLPFAYSSLGSSTTDFGISNDIPNSRHWNNFVTRVYSRPMSDTQLILDVSNITGSYYLVIRANAYYGSSSGTSNNITSFSEIRYETMER